MIRVLMGKPVEGVQKSGEKKLTKRDSILGVVGTEIDS
jgi:hypothetical protein